MEGRKIERFRASVRDVWTERTQFRDIAHELRRLTRGQLAIVYHITPEGKLGDVGHTISEAGCDWESFPAHDRLPTLARFRWQSKGSPDRFANRAVITREVVRGDPGVLRTLRE